MPIYEYRCTHCGLTFSRLQVVGATADGVLCPRCQQPDPQRLLSAFASAGSTDSSAPSSGSCGPFT